MVAKLLLFFSGLGVGVAIVLAATNVGGTQDDRCFGFGSILDETTTADGRTLVACKAGPGHYIVVDSEGNVVADDFLLDEARQYYEQHPEELPKTGPETWQLTFKPPDIPSPAIDAASKACEPDWVVTESTVASARVCHPSHWRVLMEDKAGVVFGTSVDLLPVSIVVAPPEKTYPGVTGCADPASVATTSGLMKVCERIPEGWGRQFGITLPSGRVVLVSVGTEATPEETAAAFRAAANVGPLP
jgi:hypothetical protein